MAVRVLEQYLRMAMTMICESERSASVEIEEKSKRSRREIEEKSRNGMSSEILDQSFEGILIFHIWKL
jgi:hypothetical protein